MTEIPESHSIAEIGRSGFDKLVHILSDREIREYNIVGWDGTSNGLKSDIEVGKLCPSSAFAVIAEGMTRYQRQGFVINDDSDSIRELAGALEEGSEIYQQASKVDKEELLRQIEQYLKEHGGQFDKDTDWADFIAERGKRLKARADRLDEANR